MTKTMTRFHGLARRLQNAGLRVSRSDSTETIYVEIVGLRTLRIAAHELGWADYGHREQRHRGPEVVAPATASVADILADCLDAARDEVRDCAGGYTAGDRRRAAVVLRALRTVHRRAATA